MGIYKYFRFLKMRRKQDLEKERNYIDSHSYKQLRHEHHVQCNKVDRLKRKIRVLEKRVEKEEIKAFIMQDRVMAKRWRQSN